MCDEVHATRLNKHTWSIATEPVPTNVRRASNSDSVVSAPDIAAATNTAAAHDSKDPCHHASLLLELQWTHFWNYGARFTLVSAMAHRQIIVLRNHGKWVVRSHRKEKPFETKEAALKAGVDIAHQSGKNGEPRKRILESVREHQAGLQSFRSMRRIDARRKNASALRLRFSQSLASLRQRLSQAMVRSTTQRRGNTTNPLA